MSFLLPTKHSHERSLRIKWLHQAVQQSNVRRAERGGPTCAEGNKGHGQRREAHSKRGSRGPTEPLSKQALHTGRLGASRTLPTAPKATPHAQGLGKRHKEEGLDSDDAQKPRQLFPLWTACLPLWLPKRCQSAVCHVPRESTQH